MTLPPSHPSVVQTFSSLVFLALTVLVIVVLALSFAVVMWLRLACLVAALLLAVIVRALTVRFVSIVVLLSAVPVFSLLTRPHSLVVVLARCTSALSLMERILALFAPSFSLLRFALQIVLAVGIAKHVQKVALAAPGTLILVEQTAHRRFPVRHGTEFGADRASRVKSTVETAYRAHRVLVVLVLHVDIAAEVRGVIATHFELHNLAELTQFWHGVRVEFLEVIVRLGLVYLQVLVLIFIELDLTFKCAV
jgi:hypothetical protein